MPRTGYDVIIVGAGTAGCVLAGRLAAAGDRRVLLLETGFPFRANAHSIPLLSLANLRRFTTLHRSPQQRSVHHRQLCLPQPNVVGGGSAVNGMIYIRGNRLSYDRWAALGNQGWAFADLLPYFEKVERRDGPPGDVSGGLISISRPRYLAPFSRAYLESGAELGLPLNEDFNGPSQEGIGSLPVCQRKGRRSCVVDYLGLAQDNLQVVTRATVTRLILQGHRAVGVEYHHEGELKRQVTDGEVIVSAGALGSPKLLMLSGIGPADLLRSHDIPVSVDLPGVGRNLHDHLRVPVVFASTRPPPLPPNPSSPADLVGVGKAFITYLLAKKGPLVSNNGEVGGFIKTDPSLDIPDIQFVTHWIDYEQFEGVDLEPCLIASQSRGSVSLRSNDPFAPPIWDPCFLDNDADVAKLVAGVRLARRMAKTKALAAFGLGDELRPGKDVATDEQIARYIRNAVETCFHPVGTCKMGPGDDPEAVVDPQLRVRAVEGLRVVDVSVIPTIPAGNTAAPAMVIGEKASDLVSATIA